MTGFVLGFLAVVLAACNVHRVTPATTPAPVSALAGYQVGTGAAPSPQLDAPQYTGESVAESAYSPARSLGRIWSVGDDDKGGAPPPAQVVTPATPREPEKLVVEAWFEIRTADVGVAAAQIRQRIEADGGRVVSENLAGAPGAASSAALLLRVPPDKTRGALEWIAGRGELESRRVLASDVSKLLFDQELALANLALTMTRLQKLAEREQPMKDLLELEKEMTRVRGDIERLKGEQRWLLDRVDYATITVNLSREGGAVSPLPSRGRIFPGAHVALLTLLDPGDRPRTRTGGGVTVQVRRYLTFDLDVFEAAGGDRRAVIGTVGTALYSGLFGGGRRRFGNPYLGVRAGFGSLSGEECALAAGEIGLELVRLRSLELELAARAVAFFRDDGTDVALQTQLGFTVPF